ncbi:hypothetical protein CIG75_16645 [Tumebacillus algifaecis]|uniref:Uncharacterized protein n=1 Tax=Tumebacillus algifaecis TaxID=1214604 RepID=A0A223D4Z7_9BACL|nr:hypothetical protein [Tumebacillus algifaecis]ASS76424.1 hypothetical protein CIG75_16645 [Tumebacillus algifaecis]
MERLQVELQQYADELSAHLSGPYQAQDYYDFLRNLMDATIRHHGQQTVAQMSDETILKVIKSQVSELIKLKRINKLLNKLDRI